MSKAIKEAEVKEVVEEVAEEVVERPYTLRKFKDADLFPLLQLLRKLGIKDCKEAIMASVARSRTTFDPNIYESEDAKKSALKELEKSVSIDVVVDLADFMISKIDTNKDDIYAFYSGIAGVSAEEIMEMEFGTLPLMIYDSFSEVKNTAFFKVLTKLL